MTAPSVTRRIAQSTAIVMASVLVSRLLGFLREWMVARQIGSNEITDAYYAAFTLPDFLNYLVAGGALSLTFIPVFSKYAVEEGREVAWKVFSTVVTVMALVLVALVGVAMLFAPQLVAIIAPGFGPGQREQTVFLTRLMLPAQVCFYLGSIFAAVQYAQGRFFIPSLAPILYNLAIVLGGALLAPRIGITGFAIGVLSGALAGNFLLQVYGAWRAGARFTPNFDVAHAGFRMFVKLTIPIMLAVSLVFADDWILRWFGSFLPAASITWLTYAKTLMRVPIGVVGQALGVASFPFLSRLYSEKKFDEFHNALTATLKGLVLLLVPVAALSVALSEPLVHFVFGRTRLGPTDLSETAATLAVFSLGMFAWGLQNILARAFYAAQDTLTPAVTGTAFTLLSLPVYWLLFRTAQHLGLALASALGIIAYTVALYLILQRRNPSPKAREFLAFFLRIAAASALGAGGAWLVVRWLEPRIGWQTTGAAFVVLVAGTVVGFVLAAILAKLLGVREIESYFKRSARPRER